ncbi:MAG: isoaspartyl peptidase/L-asparaginase [Nitrososphaeria archaeon]
MAFVLHGGAGKGKKDEKALSVLLKAAEIGYEYSAKGFTVDAVVEALYYVEESGMFNAGKGSVSNDAGFVEMDAGIFRGKDRAAGAVANLREGSAIRKALEVLNEGRHVLISYGGNIRKEGTGTEDLETIGAVSVSRDGDASAAASTGGIKGKRAGRIGDSAIPGAGFYALKEIGGTALTGIGEQNIRCLTAYRIVEKMKNDDPLESIKKVFFDVKKEIGQINQGAIAADSRLKMAAFTTEEAMPVCFVRSDVKKCSFEFRNGLII